MGPSSLELQRETGICTAQRILMEEYPETVGQITEKFESTNISDNRQDYQSRYEFREKLHDAFGLDTIDLDRLWVAAQECRLCENQPKCTVGNFVTALMIDPF